MKLIAPALFAFAALTVPAAAEQDAFKAAAAMVAANALCHARQPAFSNAQVHAAMVAAWNDAGTTLAELRLRVLLSADDAMRAVKERQVQGAFCAQMDDVRRSLR